MEEAHANQRNGGMPTALWNEYYDAADEALHAALEQHGKFLKLGDRAVIRFNGACSWSLLAQYAVEKALGPASTWVKTRVSDEESADSDNTPRRLPKKKVADDDSWWMKFGARWRKDLKGREMELESLEKLVRDYTRNALSQLKQMGGDPVQKEPVKTFLATILTQDSFTDTDLRFLRYDANSKPEYDEWFANKPNSQTKLEMFKIIRDFLGS